VPLLLNGQVPHKPGVATMPHQDGLLLSGRKQPVTRHSGNITATTDNSPKGDAAPPLPG
jgi:GDP-L-fucose synthase